MIRVVTYNVSGALDSGAIGEVIRGFDADIVCILEAPGLFTLRRIARRAGLEVDVRTGRGSLRVAILTGARVLRLSRDSHALRELPGVPRRRVAQSIVGVGGRRLAVFAVQFGLRPETRSLRAGGLLDLIDDVEVPAIVCADLNEGPGGPAGLRLTQRLVDGFEKVGEGHGMTFPNPDPLVRKDYILLDPTLPVRSAWVAGDPPISVLSHHRPVVVEIDEEETSRPAV
jgi:endonuclease/exonuclease/phosphatase family metal-dependent hydrolase